MIFVSKGYFESKNCLREARYAVAKAKPITLVHDSATYLSTYMTVEAIRDECPEELRTPIFYGRDIIPWHRIQDFQRVSLKLLAEQLLFGCPQEGSLTHLDRGLYIPGELPRQRMALRTRVVVYASKNNPGAMEVARDLAAGMGGVFQVTTKATAIELDQGTIKSVARAGKSVRKRASATHFLLYLNDRTYLNEAGERLAEELRSIRQEGSPTKICMVHENDLARGGCNFGIFFDGRTPQDLLQDGLYKALAIALYPDQFFPVSVAMVAKAIGATSRMCRGFITEGAERTTMIWPELVEEASVSSAPARVKEAPPQGAQMPPSAAGLAATHIIARAMFDAHTGGDEFIDAEELKGLCKEMGHELTSEEHAEVLKRLDKCGDGRIGFGGTSPSPHLDYPHSHPRPHSHL